MLRILKADFYRLFHSVMFWVAFLFSGIILVADFLIKIVSKIKGMVPEETLSHNIFEVNSSMFSGSLILFSCLAIIYFCGRERKNGFIKNIYGIVEKREYCIFSKMIISVFIAVVYAVLFWITDILDFLIDGNSLCRIEDVTMQGTVGEYFNGVLYNPGDVVFTRAEIIGKWLLLFGVALLITISMMMIFLFIMELTGITSIGYIFGFMLMTGLIDQLIVGGFFVFRSLFRVFENFDISGYLLIMNMHGLEAYFMMPEEVHLLRYTLISLAFIVVFGLLSIWRARRKDVSA